MDPHTGYIQDLRNQPQAVQDTLRALANSDPALAGISARLAQEGFHSVVLTGMGSSFHAFHPLQQALVRAGISAVMVETGELIHSLPGLLRPDALVIAASQSGQSAEIVQLVERLSTPAAATLLGISNTAGSPLALGSRFCLLTQAGEEQTVSCKTYLATLLALAWLEPVLTGAGPQGLRDRQTELQDAPQAVAAYLDGWQAHVRVLTAEMAGVRDLFLAGRGPSLAAAGVGGLIIKEAAHVHAEGLSSAAFRHGPLEMVGPESFVLVFAGPEPGASLNRRLVGDVRAAGGPAALVAMGGAGPFGLPSAQLSLLPLLEILPVEMLTLALSELRGHTAGQFERATKITASE
jgi:glutamine---fructose-6-phosphate transaminase (isomerizing)